MRPATDLDRVAASQRRFDEHLAHLGDGELRRPSLLPGWTVAHVLTHVARNADSHTRRAEAAARGEVVDQYSGGYEGRAAEIEEGARRAAADVLDDVRTSGARLADAWAAVPDGAWANVTRDVNGTERPLVDLPARRWHELEVHLVDLGTGASHRDWPDDFVVAWLPAARQTLPGRLPAGASPPAPGRLDERDELAWLYGRLRRPDLPDLAPWG